MRKLLTFAILASLLALGCRSPLDQPTEAHTAAAIPVLSTSDGLSIVYPKPEAVISASSTFLIGAVTTGSILSCNGSPVHLSAQGYFAHVVPLKPGSNDFLLVRTQSDGSSETLSVTVNREVLRSPLPANSMAIEPSTVQPSENLGLSAGDLLQLAVNASPGGQVTAVVGTRKITLQPAGHSKSKPSSVNHGLDAAYGVVYQRKPSQSPDLYTGFYRVSSEDRWTGVKPRFILLKGRRSISLVGKASLTVVQQPKIAQTAHDQTIVRLAPEQSRTTPLPAGVRLLVDGWQGESIRCWLNNTRHVWIAKDDLTFEDKLGSAPSSTVRTINLATEPSGVRVRIPLNQRLPFEIEQKMNPARLTMHLYGVTSDTDWITPAPPGGEAALINDVTWKQSADRTYDVIIRLSPSRQWGFWAEYQGTDLLLHIKAAPKVVAGGGPLAGITICVDPGHGGSEAGAIGPSGVKESTVNLAIALKLRDMLRADGAKVIMTRETDEINVSLQDRVQTAINGHADILLSVHGNALPDGRDPWQEHGSSTYWYHPQSVELAQRLKNSLVSVLGFPDYGCFYSNLALARPTNMPAVLAEIGFMINPDEYARLIDPATQEKAAAALREALVSYFHPPTEADNHSNNPG